ncbi:MAG TPA: hypothetical protein VK211_26690 [Kamptonema sp.]|nr:hypothetical protein [Kamptonema sp.]
MSETKIDRLTPEQEALIPVYQEKWRRIAFSTEPIDHQKITIAVKAMYDLIDLQEPELFFSDSPYEAFTKIEPPLLFSQRGLMLCPIQFWEPLVMPLYTEVRSQLGGENIWYQLPDDRSFIQGFRHDSQLVTQLEKQINNQLTKSGYNLSGYNFSGLNILDSSWISECAWLDFCISVLNCSHNPKIWPLLQSIAKDCGWILLYKKVAIICDRPRILCFDNQHRLHAEGTPAIQFADGYSLYSYHGVTLPEKYGKLHPHQWQSQWLLEEENAELRRVLIQGIGYSRICQELEAVELDTWREYSLLRIDKNIDIEPINMLKMTCPSTGHIHTLRVPPNLKSARKAIKWVNWGVDAEDFSVQT